MQGILNGHYFNRSQPSALSRSWFFVWYCLISLLCVNAQTQPGIVAEVDRDSVAFGETINFTLTFHNISVQGVPSIKVPANLRIEYRGQSSNTSINNGKFSQALILNYEIIPTQIGEYTLPAMSFQVGGKTLSTTPVKFKVVKNPQQASGQTNTQPQIAFVKLLVPKEEVYVGEVLPVEIRLFYQNAENLQLPQVMAEGFTVGKIQYNQQPSQTRVGNIPYNYHSFYLPVTPIKTGDLALGPAQCSLILIIPQTGNRRRNSPFDLMDDPFSFFGPPAERRSATLKSDPLTLKVLPLPKENVPANYHGAVGSYQLSVSASPTNLSVGDPITVTMKITGKGPLETLTLPSLDQWKEFKLYPPSSKVESTDQLGLSGVKTFEFVAVPQSPTIQLPALSFSFFDPEAKKYTTLQPNRIPLNIKAAAQSTPSATVVSSSQAKTPVPPVDDIINIKSRLGMIVSHKPWTHQGWYWTAFSLPFGCWFFSWIWHVYSHHLNRNPRMRRQREVERFAHKNMSELKRLASAHDVEAFYALVFRLMQERLGERLDLPASAITEAVVSEHLQPQGIDDETIRMVDEIFQRCNWMRFASTTEGEELLPFWEKVAKTLDRIKGIKLEGR